MPQSFLKLCLVTQINNTPLNQYLELLNLAIDGGITCVQFRDKTSSVSSLRNHVMAIKSLLDSRNIPLIINDHVNLALEINANGVHIGQKDLVPDKARAVLGSDKVIGLSIESYRDLEKANQSDCINYVAASAVFVSKSKTDCRTIWGLNGLEYLSKNSKYPIIAIGGISTRNVRNVIRHGAQGIAVISAIHDAPSPFTAAQQLNQLIAKENDYV